MLRSISALIGSITPSQSTMQYALTGAIIGRKVCLAAGYKIGGIVAERLGKNNAEEWYKTSDEYLALAKKGALRDLTLIAAPVAFSLTLDVPSSYTLSLAKLSFLASAVIAGRKAGLALTYKVASAIAGAFGQDNVSEWDQLSHDYLELAKKDLSEDLIDAAPLFLVSLGLQIGGEIKVSKERIQYHLREISQEEEKIANHKNLYFIITKITALFA
jgi:hypothetical protein